MRAEDKILGRPVPKKQQETEADVNYFAPEHIWKVEKDGCGVSEFNGRMAYEMMDAGGKRAVKSGAKELQNNGFKFKLVK